MLYPPLFWGSVLLYLRSPKGGCCSVSDDLSCFCNKIYSAKEKMSLPWLKWCIGEKEGDLTKTYDENPIPTENSKTNEQHKNATKNFDYTTIADRLRTVSWSDNSHPTGCG